jgi:hypothetical protein
MGQGQEKGNGNEGLRASARRRSCQETIGGPPEMLKGVRDRAILGTLLDRGIRREELCLLRLRDTQSRQGRVCNASDDTHEDLVGTRLFHFKFFNSKRTTFSQTTAARIRMAYLFFISVRNSGRYDSVSTDVISSKYVAEINVAV